MRTNLRAALVAIAIGAVYFIGTGARAFSTPPANGSPAPEFTGISQWLNSTPLTMHAQRGKLVLVDFWTYSCINCLNTLPYVTRWYDKYKDQGLVVVGVHTPEYAFEKSTANVQEALNRLGVRYPVAQDNGYATWSAFHNQYWPALYLIDVNGRIVYQHFGEGNYAETETVIQKLLAERNPSQPT
ncbi:thioredoxin family protein [Ralstonia wenshanensis]|uniref:thioredoxin family protein n=1 Tax=Ralstonia wenshanensis TaxID=2842456 RepID=UPI002AAD6B5C|nr:thioredoxin family protein [Ralstonia wenshanensis]MDY7511258.1 thioredoxin family protein [Ralstonia wenshanensis]